MTLATVTVRGQPTPHAIPGWVTRRVVLAGEVLREPAAAPMPLVSAGAPVQFEINQSGLRLSLDGVAMSAASLGERVAVRLGAKRRVVGIVAGPARVIAIDSLRIS
jgi:flagella basal body P-ring formation protein FlgA